MSIIKKKSVILFVIVLFSFSIVYADLSVTRASDCSASKTVLKLSGVTNAHAAVWNDAAYSYAVCAGIEGSHTCKDWQISPGYRSGNGMGLLSSRTDAHIRAPGASGPLSYIVPVCFDDFHSCSTYEGSCPSEKKCVFKVSNWTNAHLASCSDNSYSFSVCCSNVVDTSVETPPAEPAEEVPPAEVPPEEPAEEVPAVPGIECETSSDCAEGEVCVTRDGTGGTCQSCEGARDEDGDDLDDCTEDTCVGDADHSGSCRSGGGGRSCNSLSGYLCSSGICINGHLSDISREINCCVSDGDGSVGCEGAPIYTADLGIVQRVDRTCLGDGLAQETIITINPDGTESSGTPLNVEDAGCGSAQFGSGESVPGYGITAIGLTLVLLILFYLKKGNRKLLKS